MAASRSKSRKNKKQAGASGELASLQRPPKRKARGPGDMTVSGKGGRGKQPKAHGERPIKKATPASKGKTPREAAGSHASPPVSLAFTTAEKGALPLMIVELAGYEKWLASAPEALREWLKGSGFRPAAGRSALIPGSRGPVGAIVVVERANRLWDYADLPRALPVGDYDAEPELERSVAEALSLGWGLGCYRYERYKKKGQKRPRLVWPRNTRRERVQAIAEAICLTRDLITTPASDMGPQELSREAAALAARHGAKFEEIVGDALLEENYPMVHAVGRASVRPPRLIDLRWGKAKNQLVTLVGKGVCFDTGGLDLKPSQYMLLMKKDMGGAALVLGLAHAIMSLELPVRLRVLIPAVENSVSGNAMRPLDVLSTRKGITVEVGNTDAEGRLVLGDALTEALTDEPDLLIDAATLTGAARVALGASMPAIFANRDDTWRVLEQAAEDLDDPLWRLPLHEPYRKKLDSRVADISSTGDSLAGAITAALFLREFATSKADWVHMDTMGYNTDALPGRPRGGEAFGLRALLELIERRYVSPGS